MDDLDLGSTVKGFATGQKVFGRYMLKKILGRGGMGVVWLARDEKLEREIALKFLPEVVALDARAVLDLKRETRRALELTHPHIVRIHDFIDDNQTAAIAMEYVAGDSLAKLALDQPNHVFAPGRLQEWMRQLCSALDYAHNKAQIVHRDLKPANLMVDARGDLKIADFGIAASVSDSVSRVSVRAGSSGTPVYMSPQQMMGDKPAVTDDIYALGATLYDLLSGKPPFHSGNILAQVQGKEAQRLNARRAEFGFGGEPVPAEWEQTIAACLAKEARDRPQSVREFVQRLGLGSSSTAVPFTGKSSGQTPAAPGPSAVPGASSVRSRTPLYVGLAAAVLGLAVAGWYFGSYVPEQKRRAEVARLELQQKISTDTAETQRLEVEAAKLRTTQEQAAAESKARTEQALVAAERLSAARGGIIVRSEPADAEVTVGALEHGSAPLTLKEVRLGKYPVKARLPGYDDWSGEVEVKENEFAEVSVHLMRSTGKLQVATSAGGMEVDIRPEGKDGAAQRIRPPQNLTLPTGSYTLVFKRPGWSDRIRRIVVARGGAETVEESYADTNRPADWLFHASTPELAAAAESGWLGAQIQMGDRHLCGLGVKVNYPEALRWYQRAAGAGVASATGRLVLLAERSGIGIKESGDSARWLMEGVRAGDPVAVLTWHGRLKDGWTGDPVPAAKIDAVVNELLRISAEGDTVAMMTLARHYLVGRTSPNAEEGLKWARAAIDVGNVTAVNYLAYAYSEGRGVPKDEAKSLEWGRKAAEAGDAGAIRAIGLAYFEGRGVAKDEAVALKWFRQAADMGNSNAMVSLGVTYSNGNGVTKDDAAAVAWLRKAADMGNLGAFYNLGWAYSNGRGVSADDAAALVWWRKAADMGSRYAQSSIGYAYSNGKGVAQNDAEAVLWWKKAAVQDDYDALHNLGWAYANGRGVTKDDAEAVNYWKRAAKLGSAESQKALTNRGLTWEK